MSLASERRALVERAFPGVTCSRVAFEIRQYAADGMPEGRAYHVNICVKAPAAVLITHGLVAVKRFNLPPSGKRSGLKRLSDGTFQASVFWYDWHGCGKPELKGREMAARIGLTPDTPKEVKRTREIAGRRVSWKTAGDVIHIDWQTVRLGVELQRQAGAL